MHLVSWEHIGPHPIEGSPEQWDVDTSLFWFIRLINPYQLLSHYYCHSTFCLISAHHNILGGWYLMSHNSYQPSLNVMPVQHSDHSQHVMIMAFGFDKIESTFYQHSAHSTFYPLSFNSQLVVMWPKKKFYPHSLNIKSTSYQHLS